VSDAKRSQSFDCRNPHRTGDNLFLSFLSLGGTTCKSLTALLVQASLRHPAFGPVKNERSFLEQVWRESCFNNLHSIFSFLRMGIPLGSFLPGSLYSSQADMVTLRHTFLSISTPSPYSCPICRQISLRCSGFSSLWPPGGRRRQAFGGPRSRAARSLGRLRAPRCGAGPRPSSSKKRV